MSGRPGTTRRRVLRTLGAALPAVGLAGCAVRADAVSVLAAGSLQAAFTDGLQDETDESVEVEAHGSARAARMVVEGQRDPDVLALADPQLFTGLLASPWHARFASNAIVLAYNPETPGGRAVGAAAPWYEPLLGEGESANDGGADEGPTVRLGRTDPELDPLGYRTLFALRLAAAHYDRPSLPEGVLGPDQRYPETQLMARFETGAVDAAFVYRSMAVERDYPYRDLPAAVDLSDPDRADAYGAVEYTFADGETVAGAPIEYAARLRGDGDRARAVFEAIVESARGFLDPHGFTVAPRHPTYVGDVPQTLRG